MGRSCVWRDGEKKGQGVKVLAAAPRKSHVFFSLSLLSSSLPPPGKPIGMQDEEGRLWRATGGWAQGVQGAGLAVGGDDEGRGGHSLAGVVRGRRPSPPAYLTPSSPSSFSSARFFFRPSRRSTYLFFHTFATVYWDQHTREALLCPMVREFRVRAA